MPLLLLFLFIFVPIAELYVIIQVGDAIGVVPTLAILVVDGIVGAALTRSQGRAAWRRFNEATGAGRVPAKEVFDGAAIIVGGAFLLAPGFITDVLGLSLILPPTRAAYRRLLMGTARRIGPLRPYLFVYDRRGWAKAGTRRTPPADPPRDPTPPSKGYDVEGSAHEIPSEPREIGRGEGER